MVEVAEEGYVLDALSRATTPAAMVATIAQVENFDTLTACFEDSSSDFVRALVKQAIIAGKAHSLAGYGDGIAKKLGEKFGISERHMDRLIRTYREIVLPRLERDGDNATFLLGERMFYDVACEAAPVLQIPAVELIEQAEEKKANDPKFTPSRWKRELGLSGDEGSTTSDAPSIIKQLRKIAKATEDRTALEDVALHFDNEKPKKARAILDDVRDASVAIGELLAMLEDRAGGRIDA